MANGYVNLPANIPSEFWQDALSGQAFSVNNITTTDDTVTVLELDSLQDNSIYDVEWTIIAQRTDDTGRAAFKRLVRAYRNGAGAAVGQTDTIGTDYNPSTFGGLTIDATGNSLRLRVEGLPIVQAELVDQDITYVAVLVGADGNDITVQYANDGTAGAETVNVTASAILVHMDPTPVTGSSATQIEAALDAYELANPGVLSALVTYSITGAGATVQNSHAALNLAGGETPTINWKVQTTMVRID